MAEEQDKFVMLVNPKGEEEQVWDFDDHVERLLSMGFSRPMLQKKVQQVITTKDKET